MDMELSVQEVETFSIRDKDGELYVRIYGAVNEDEKNRIRPLLILLPPVAGSHTVTEGVCLNLRDRGFAVLTYSRPGFDSPAFDGQGIPVRLSIPRLSQLFFALTKGFTYSFANTRSRELEDGRKEDTEILLRELAQNKTLQDKLGPGRNTIFLAGYGSGGAALTYLSGQEDFAARYPQVKGIITVEAPLFSSMASDPPYPPEESPSFFTRVKLFFHQFFPKEITHIENIPRPLLPALFIVSDRVIQDRDGRYETILRALGASQNTSLLAAVPGAGPLDYSNSPRYYPILSFLFPGDADTESQAAGAEVTALLITNFAALILSGEEDTSSLLTTPLDRDIYLETGGVWNIPNSRTILHP
jgi:hypothetical protein